MLTKLKGLEKFGLIEEQKKLLDDVTELIKAKKQLEKEAIQWNNKPYAEWKENKYWNSSTQKCKTSLN